MTMMYLLAERLRAERSNHDKRCVCWQKGLEQSAAIMTSDVYVSQIQTYERFERTLFIRPRQNQQIFGVIPFVKLQNDT